MRRSPRLSASAYALALALAPLLLLAACTSVEGTLGASVALAM
ncbi:MAG: hypothetical protein ACRDHE_06335 [Ktedonobacterales bacterium]